MKPEQIKVGRTYRMTGRMRDRRIVDIVVYTSTVAGQIADYQMAIVEIVGGKGRRVKEYLPWLAADALFEVHSR